MSTVADPAAGEWDDAAATFDAAPDHGLRDPSVRAAWARLLLPLLPPDGGLVADLGCGTGSLAVLLAEAGHRVVGVDFAARMLDQARAKAAVAGVPVAFARGDAAHPPLRPGAFDAVVDRHVLWALPDLDAALARWTALLPAGGGTLLLVEGRWSTGAGLPAATLTDALRRHRPHVDLVPLDDPTLWGQAITDDRYLLVSRS